MTVSQDNGQNRYRRFERLIDWIKTLGISAVINAAIVLILFLIVFPPPRDPPPSFKVAYAPPEEPPDQIQNHTVQRQTRLVDTGNASSGMALPITATKSSFAIDVPELNSLSPANVPGLLSGFGTGDGVGDLGRGSDGMEASLGGMKVRAVTLGVVLDVSGSMKEEIRAVRRELNREFSRATVVEVSGCTMVGSDLLDIERELIRKRRSFGFNAPSTLQAIDMLILHKNVDAIFWFSDLQDQQDPEGMERLAKLLRVNRENGIRPVRFYVRSVQRQPSESLKKVVKRSGGAVKYPQRNS